MIKFLSSLVHYLSISLNLDSSLSVCVNIFTSEPLPIQTQNFFLPKKRRLFYVPNFFCAFKFWRRFLFVFSYFIETRSLKLYTTKCSVQKKMINKWNSHAQSAVKCAVIELGDLLKNTLNEDQLGLMLSAICRRCCDGQIVNGTSVVATVNGLERVDAQ
jgi:hypothetical protein